jgi:hypothetical protein
LDEIARAATWHLVREYVRRGGAALVTSHILADIESFADRVVAMSDGQVVLQDSLSNVRSRLGGSWVSITLRRPVTAALIEQISRAGRGEHMPVQDLNAPDDARVRLAWRTRDALPLVATIARLAPGAADLLVQPIPLRELLRELEGPRPATAPAAPTAPTTPTGPAGPNGPAGNGTPSADGTPSAALAAGPAGHHQ